MPEIHIRNKTNGSIITVDSYGNLTETLPSSFNATGAISLKRLEIVDRPGPDTFTLVLKEEAVN